MTDNISVPAAQTNVEKPATAPAAPVTVAAPTQAPNTNAPAQPAPAAPVVAVAVPVAPNPTVTPPTTQSPVAQPSPAAAPVVAKPVVEEEEEEEILKPDELSMLKARASLMGIAFSNNIGLDALKQKIAEKVNGEAKPELPEEDEEPVDERSPVELAKPAPTLRQRLLQDNMRLIRVRITCLDPKKKDLPGEIITVANRYIGTVRKFVPFGEVTEGGYHIPYVIFKMLKKRKFLNIRVRPNPKGGQDIVESKYVPEFAIEELPQLTAVELERLARAQIAAGSVEAGGVQ